MVSWVHAPDFHPRGFHPYHHHGYHGYHGYYGSHYLASGIAGLIAGLVIARNARRGVYGNGCCNNNNNNNNNNNCNNGCNPFYRGGYLGSPFFYDGYWGGGLLGREWSLFDDYSPFIGNWSNGSSLWNHYLYSGKFFEEPILGINPFGPNITSDLGDNMPNMISQPMGVSGSSPFYDDLPNISSLPFENIGTGIGIGTDTGIGTGTDTGIGTGTDTGIGADTGISTGIGAGINCENLIIINPNENCQEIHIN